MPKKREPESKPGAGLPVYMTIPLGRILEPELPARASMDTQKMTELIESMRAVGQIEPVTVEQQEGMFELITGHRRFLAARSLGWTEIKAIVYAEGMASKLAVRLHENTVREDLNAAEEALFMAQAREALALDEEGLCKTFHRTPEYIAGRFALLRGDPEIFGAVQRGDIRLGVAHQLNRIGDQGMRRYYLDAARRADPPVRVVAQWVSEWLAQERGRQLTVSAGGAEEGAAVNPNSPPGVGTPPDGAAGSASTAAPAPFFGCMLCGGDRDPFNLIDVKMHKWEWQHILESVEKAARGGGA